MQATKVDLKPQVIISDVDGVLYDWVSQLLLELIKKWGWGPTNARGITDYNTIEALWPYFRRCVQTRADFASVVQQIMCKPDLYTARAAYLPVLQAYKYFIKEGGLLFFVTCRSQEKVADIQQLTHTWLVDHVHNGTEDTQLRPAPGLDLLYMAATPLAKVRYAASVAAQYSPKPCLLIDDMPEVIECCKRLMTTPSWPPNLDFALMLRPWNSKYAARWRSPRIKPDLGVYTETPMEMFEVF
jgi:hypothetical protein